MANPLRVEQWEIEGFRGVNRPLQVTAGVNATLISAPNGSGKTSVLDAIEWCLYGRLPFVLRENATNDEVVNMLHPGGRARVRLVLSGSAGKFTIQRERKVGKRETSLTVQGPGRATSGEDDAEAFLFRLVGLTFDDFHRAVYLHQESIRGLLLDDPRFRDEAIDRLLGIDRVRSLLASMPMKVVSDALEDLDAQEQRLSDRLVGASQETEAQRSRYLAEAISIGLDESNLTLDHGKEVIAEVRVTLQKVSSEQGHPVVDLPEPVEIEDLERVSRRIASATKDIRLEAGSESPLDEAASALSDLRGLKTEFDRVRAALRESQQELGAHSNKHGSEDSLTAERDKLRQEVALSKDSLKVIGIETRVVADAIEYLEAVPTAGACPVCGDPKDATKLASELRRRVREHQLKESERLNRVLDGAKTRLTDIADAEKERTRISQQVAEAKNEVDRVVVEAGKLLPKAPTEEKLSAAISVAEEVAKSKLERLKTANKRREGELQLVDSAVERIRAIHKFLRSDQDFVRVRERSHSQTGESTASLVGEKTELLALEQDIKGIVEVLNELASQRATEAIEGTRESAARFYGTLCRHPYFDGMRIDLRQKLVGGVQKNSYSIRAFSSKDGRETLAGSRLSTAQMNCVALSIYLSLAGTLAHNLGFLILDDPSQSLDREHKQALAEVLQTIQGKVQVIMATHDDELDLLMTKSPPADGFRRYKLNWTPAAGSTLR